MKNIYLTFAFLFILLPLFAQQGTIIGIVSSCPDIDNNTQPLPSVLINKKHSNRKPVFTDQRGLYAIDAEVGDTLVFSYIGFQSKEIVVKEDRPVEDICLSELPDISAYPSQQRISEVVTDLNDKGSVSRDILLIPKRE
jgi:iron complex outermembrane receptor protein